MMICADFMPPDCPPLPPNVVTKADAEAMACRAFWRGAIVVGGPVWLAFVTAIWWLA